MRVSATLCSKMTARPLTRLPFVSLLHSRTIVATTTAISTTSPTLSCSSSSSTLFTPMRSHHTLSPTLTLYQQTTNNNNSSHKKVSALDVAMQVNQLKRLHQQGATGSNRRQVEAEAWALLNSLQDEQINAAEGKAVALLLNTWAYFAKFWENGKDGPAGANTGAGGSEDESK